jgi:hypothetical protein
MWAVLLGLYRLMPEQNAWVLGGGGIVIGGGVFLLSTALLRSPELGLVLAAIRRRRLR